MTILSAVPLPGQSSGPPYQLVTAQSIPNCAIFDGSTAYLQATTTSSFYIPAGGFTLGIWVRQNTTPSSGNVQGLVDCDSGAAGWKLQLFNGISFKIAGSHKEFGTIATVLQGQWAHIHVTCNTSTLAANCYLHGGLVQTSPQTMGASFAASASQLTIGAGVGPTQFFNGSIGPIKLWNAELSAAQVADDHLRGGTALDPTNLIFATLLQGDYSIGSPNTVQDVIGGLKFTMNGTLAWGLGTGPSPIPAVLGG